MLLLDNSAWSRIVAVALPSDRAERVADWVAEGQLATCLPFLLEAGFSARTSAHYRAMMAHFESYPRVELTVRTEQLALRTQRQLAASGHHRLAPVDVLIAACAHDAEAAVLHYDRDYDLIAAHTDLSFDSVWLASPGAL